MIRRREFIAGLGRVATWPLTARAQQDGRVRRTGVLAAGPTDDPATRAYFAALRERLGNLGWIEGLNPRIDLCFTGSDPDRMRAYAVEMVSLAPEVIVTGSAPATRSLSEY